MNRKNLSVLLTLFMMFLLCNITFKTHAETTPETNIDPSNAYFVEHNMYDQNTLNTSGESRWYYLTLNECSKVTILLDLEETLDADIYMYSLNPDSYELDYLAECTDGGLGILEYYNSVMDSGTYYFEIYNYEGAGEYTFDYYQSSIDATLEINDSLETAHPITCDSSTIGVIDNPDDFDYYTLTITQPTLVKYSISSNDGYTLACTDYSIDTTAPIEYILSSNTSAYKLNPGIYYFAVYSEDCLYSATSPYTITFTKVGSFSGDSAITHTEICEDANIIYETDATGTINYINGNPIDISYSFVETISNSAGYQSYDISIDATAGASAYTTSPYNPVAVYYFDSTRAAMYIDHTPALMLTYHSTSNFYKVHCIGTGAYSTNTYWHDYNEATVLIDPATGKLIDIVDFNYYYDFAPIGSNSITFTTPYTLEILGQSTRR